MDDSKYFMEHKNESQRRWFAWRPNSVTAVKTHGVCVCARTRCMVCDVEVNSWTWNFHTKQMDCDSRTRPNRISEWKKSLCAKCFGSGQREILDVAWCAGTGERTWVRWAHRTFYFVIHQSRYPTVIRSLAYLFAFRHNGVYEVHGSRWKMK